MFLCRIVWKYNIAGKPIYLPVRAGDLVNAIVICDDMFDDGIMVSLELFYLCDSDLTSTTMTQHYYKPLMYRLTRGWKVAKYKKLIRETRDLSGNFHYIVVKED
jgi:hypothetical protein